MTKLLVPAVLVLAATTAFAADVNGKWKIHNSISGSESDQECTFTQTEKAITGTCKTTDAEVKVTGTVEDKKISFKYDTDYNGTSLTLTYTGMIDDSGNFKGDVDVQPFGVTGEFTAVASKPGSDAKK